MDISTKAAEVIKLRGVGKVIEGDIFLYEQERFDTLLLLMNGIGLTGTVDKLRLFLQHAKKLLLPDGQLIFDSSDIAYLYEGNLPAADNYYGELLCEYAYKRIKSGWFGWLYIDKQLLKQIAIQEGFLPELLFEDGNDQYLVKLTVKG
jgi:hypothetical protein